MSNQDLYYRIKDIYPDIQPEEFLLRHDGDGVYTIAEWNSQDPQPTQEQLDAADAAAAASREAKREELLSSDVDMARAAEDIYDLLIAKGVATTADFAPELVTKMEKRKTDRAGSKKN